MKVYHCTTRKKLLRYKRSKCILPPVRYWTSKSSAIKWSRKTHRDIILVFNEPESSYPLPIKYGAKWSPQPVYSWELLE